MASKKHGRRRIKPPVGGFKVKIKDSKNDEGYIQEDATWGSAAVTLTDSSGKWYFTTEDDCGICEGCFLGLECEFPVYTDYYLTVTNSTLTFSSTSSTWTLSSKKKLSASGLTGYVEVSGTSLKLGTTGHDVTTE